MLGTLAEPGSRSHLVQFYEDDEFLVETVARFLGAGLAGGEGVIAIATADHLTRLRDRLTRNSFDVDRACESGQLTLLDAAETLSRFMVGDHPDPERFVATIAPVVERSRRRRNGLVRAYGEMVDLLCRQNNHEAALGVERLWSRLTVEHPLSLLCGYIMHTFDTAEHGQSFQHVCEAHTHVLAAESYAVLQTDDARHREVSLLQQRARALEGEIEHRKALERALREREAELTRDIAERKRAEDELRDTVQRLNAVLEQMPSAVIIVEAPTGKPLLANGQNAAIFRQPAAPLDELFAPRRFVGLHEDGRELRCEEWPLSRSFMTGEVVQGEEIRIVRGDGSHGHIRVNSTPIRDSSGNIVAGIVTYDDVTDEKEQRRATEALLRISTVLSSELDLDALMQRLTDEATALCRAEFGAFFYNVLDDAGESYTLYTLSGAPREAFAGFPTPRVTALFEPTFSGKGVVRLDDVKKDPRYGRTPPHHGIPAGHLPVTSYLAVPVKSRAGEIFGGLFFGHSSPGVFTEADERLLVAVSAQAAIAIENARLYQGARRAERLAEQERRRLHDLFMQAPVSIAILRGPDHVIEFANPLARKRFRGREIIGKPLRDAIPGANPSLIEVLDETFRSGEPYVGTEVPVALDWDGTGDAYERFFNIVYEPYRQGSGDIAGIMAFSFEVTEQVVARRKVEAIVQELETANRTKDDFLATVSHELRTPLNAMLGWTRMLRSGMVAEDRREKALETIERNAHAQMQLIEDLLDVSRIISGKMRLEVKSVDLAQVVGNAVEAVRPAASAKGIDISQTMDPSVGPILGDGDRIQQVVWNLLSNAVKFTPKDGRVQVVVGKRDSFINIIVADNGQGIDPDFLPHVFERFRQADAATTRKHMGLGLGLAIVRHLVELHGGHVRVESEGAGKGASFIVSLPISPLSSASPYQMPAIRQPASPPPLACPPELDGVHVLIVEDDKDARELLVQVLEPCKARISTAPNVPEALQLVEQARPDVIVSDIGLPGEDGYAFIKKLRALPANRGGKTPAVALTAYARVEDRTRALVAGFNMHVPKPVEPTELMAVLSSLSMMFHRA